MRKVIKKYFYRSTIALILLYGIYLLKIPIAISILTIYGHLSSNNKTEVFLAEYYRSLSLEIEKKAQDHFKHALVMHQSKLKKSNLTPSERHFVEYLVGNSYECGKGTTINLNTAKFWYTKAAKGGIKEATIALDRLKESQATTCHQHPK